MSTLNLERIDDYERQQTSEQKLWGAVIWKAFSDLHYASTPAHEIISILNWFDIKNKDFLIVCDLAGLNPEFILRNISENLPPDLKKIYKQNLHKKIRKKTRFEFSEERLNAIKAQSEAVADNITWQKCKFESSLIYFFKHETETYWQWPAISKIIGSPNLPDLSMFPDRHFYWLPQYTKWQKPQNIRIYCLYFSQQVVEYIIESDPLLKFLMYPLRLRMKYTTGRMYDILKKYYAEHPELQRSMND